LRTNYSCVGKIERAVRRCLIYYGPLPTGALIRSIYGRRRPQKTWWRWSIYRAAPKYADKVGGRCGLWVLREG
jgi:hypothetical protein